METLFYVSLYITVALSSLWLINIVFDQFLNL